MEDKELCHQEIFDRNPLNLNVTGNYSKNKIQEVELAALKNVFNILANPQTKIIRADGILRAYYQLNESITKKEIEKMIWEVDDDLDGGLDWREFITMCHRCIVDTDGTEPCRLYTLVQYLTFDRNLTGKIALTKDETMTILHVRHGKHGLDDAISEMKPNADTYDAGFEVTFKEFNKTRTDAIVARRNLRKKYSPEQYISGSAHRNILSGK